jgi:urease alpha subunit
MLQRQVLLLVTSTKPPLPFRLDSIQPKLNQVMILPHHLQLSLIKHHVKIKKKSKRNRKAAARGTGQLRISNNTGVSSAAAGGAQSGGTGGLNLSR